MNIGTKFVGIELSAFNLLLIRILSKEVFVTLTWNTYFKLNKMASCLIFNLLQSSFYLHFTVFTF